jgi:5-methyltetrahydropteroyltriglutamate--homocysteine methyltransferase
MADRILTTHVGALQRPPEAEAALIGEADEAELRSAVVDVVREQADAGIDIVNDGEFGKSIWQWYVTERLDGVVRKEHEAPPLRGRDHAMFADFYAYAAETPDVLFHGTDRAFWASIATRPVCVGPIAYKRGPVERDIANLKKGLEGVDVVDAFMPVVAPASAEVDMGNEHYATQEELLWALADALREEYRAIIDAEHGFPPSGTTTPASTSTPTGATAGRESRPLTTRSKGCRPIESATTSAGEAGTGRTRPTSRSSRSST